jgi:hypothetical protein
MKEADYDYIIVESFVPNVLTGHHGLVHIRPVANQEPYQIDMLVECNKDLVNDYPIGTKFRIKAKITSKQGGKPFVYSHYKWNYEVLK